MATHKPIITKKGTELPILDMKGKPYLQVAYRLVWFREEHPDWRIETQLLKFDDEVAICRAEIKNEKGDTIGTGTKREDRKHFSDHIEKAETGSIGRALAMCGYGTQFEPDLDEGHRIVDSPMDRTQKSDDFKSYTQTTVNPMSDLKEFVVSVGGDRSAIKGKKFNDIAIDVLLKEANGAFDWFQKQGKEIPPAWMTFFTNVEQYTGSKIGVR